MKYKVLLVRDSNAGGQPDGTMSSFSFYTLSQAQACCSLWVEAGAIHIAWLWNGSSWTLYQP